MMKKLFLLGLVVAAAAAYLVQRSQAPSGSESTSTAAKNFPASSTQDAPSAPHVAPASRGGSADRPDSKTPIANTPTAYAAPESKPSAGKAEATVESSDASSQVAIPSQSPGAPHSAQPYPQISLLDVLKPGNRYEDAWFQMSLQYPEGWSVRDAMRWGLNNGENTISLNPPPGLNIQPSVYYQNFPLDQGRPANAEATLREMAQLKENSRRAGGRDYQNHPESFVFREIDGRPSLSYFATYSQNGQVHAEYFMRILGQKGYVMFFVRGPAAHVQAAIPEVYKMGTTVRIP